MRAALPGSVNNNGERKANPKNVGAETGDIQSLVDITVEQKVKPHLQDIEKAIAQIQADMADLRK
jgi:hypothetical protein